nr:hypothetical protein CFP56_03375 [Quercus suber]
MYLRLIVRSFTLGSQYCQHTLLPALSISEAARVFEVSIHIYMLIGHVSCDSSYLVCLYIGVGCLTLCACIPVGNADAVPTVKSRVPPSAKIIDLDEHLSSRCLCLLTITGSRSRDLWPHAAFLKMCGEP